LVYSRGDRVDERLDISLIHHKDVSMVGEITRSGISDFGISRMVCYQ
jgi:hypothetical protein